MPQIGEFTRDETGFVGHLTTLVLNQDVIIIAAEPTEVENAPQYRVHVFDGMNNEPGAEIGAGWKGRVRQCGVELGVTSGLHFQAALGVICSGCASSIIGVARAAMPSICM